MYYDIPKAAKALSMTQEEFRERMASGEYPAPEPHELYVYDFHQLLGLLRIRNLQRQGLPPDWEPGFTD